MKQFEIKNIPNQKGFQFIAIYKDGHEEMQQVKVNEFGIHYIDNYMLIDKWRRIENYEWDVLAFKK